MEIGSNTNVKGTVTKADGTTPIPFVNVYIYNSNWTSYYYTYTDKNGNYGFGDIPAGSYTFSVYSPPATNGENYYPPANSTITVESSGATTKNISFLAATKTLTGQITRTSTTGATIAVTDANVWVSKIGGNGWANANTDSSGNYSLTLTGGSWYIGVNPTTWPSDWTYTYSSETISFADDTTTESKTKNYTVESLNSTVNGSIKKPDGSTPAQYSVGLNLSNTKNQWYYASVDASGNFTVKVTAGTYSVSGWVTDSNYSFPKVATFTVNESETKTLETITLVEKSDTISGTILDNFGSPVAGASINGWKSNGSWDWSSATTDTNGNYTLKVTPGTWQVNAWPQWDSGYVYSGQPVSVSVTSGVTATKNFTFQKATVTVNGTVTDPDGNVLTTLYAWASANDGSQQWSNVGASVNNGKFTMKIPAGTWDISVYIYAAEYGSPDPKSITVVDNETVSVTLAAVKYDATISGTVYDESNNPVTSTWMSIYATKGKYGAWQSANFDQANGTYSIKVSAGTWKLGWWVDPNLGYSSGTGQDTEVTVASGETKTHNITLKKADSTISGTAKNSEGGAVAWAWVNADSRDPNEKVSADTYYYSNGTSSASTGEYTLKVPAGTYWVGANMWPGSGYINPKREKVSVDANNPATVNLVFRKADASITGKVTLDGTGTSAFISAYSEDGGYAETNSSNAGEYTLSVSSETKWHLKAIKQVDKDIYKSSEAIVDLTQATTGSQDLVLAKKSYSLPDAVTVTFDATKQQTIKLDDETTINIPANTATSSGNVTLTAQPEANLAEEADAKPVSYGYDLNIVDSNGKEITEFTGNVTIEVKYEDEWITDSGLIDEKELKAAYYDESAGTWIELGSVTVNETEKTVTFQTDHFTKFAVVGAADTTPPAAPTNQAASAGDSKVSLSWTNPTDADLNGINIYRSTTSGVLGTRVHSSVTGTSKDDTDLTNGTAYYYTLRAVDKSNNESTNTTQISATPSAAASTTTTTTTTTSTSSSNLPETGRETISLVTILTLLIISFLYLTFPHRRFS